jgi:hypothetical protein
VPDPEPKSLPQTATELWELTKDYARQETITPLKDVGRYVGYGMGGALLGSVGVILLMFAGLRALQTETGSTFTGNWSWAPYVIVTFVAGLLVALAVNHISKKSKKR